MWNRSVAAAILSTLVVGPLAAQNRPIELGLDGGFAYKLDDPTAFTIQLPLQAFRVGFFASEQVSVEPAVAWNLIKVSDLDAVYTLSGLVGLLYHFTPGRERSQVYVRPFAGVDLVGGGGETANQFSVGGGIGLKTPVRNRLGARIEAGFEYGFENDDFDKSSHLFLKVGFSFLAR